ncbi:hypothetical protein GNF10_27580 [Nostoc sp. UCD121]|uniref:hypothetical protein n=1 Tax=unclassified Nostoc TaxID=2593658 RepID=UPI001624F149|nr:MULTISPECIES: hypothetical protein [unclassified Nostoc]MBC1223350.1 hypothetical protein [Nostoc sp. UCD120]MBC1279617.1 hypothetical protein [Nostoc sp. UCD121]MBC1299265.1 hypothetical protein [Nostoc sp. UCD122]
MQLIVADEPDLGTVVKSDGAERPPCPHSDRKSFQSTEVAFLTINSLEEILQ